MGASFWNSARSAHRRFKQQRYARTRFGTHPWTARADSGDVQTDRTRTESRRTRLGNAGRTIKSDRHACCLKSDDDQTDRAYWFNRRDRWTMDLNAIKHETTSDARDWDRKQNGAISSRFR